MSGTSPNDPTPVASVVLSCRLDGAGISERKHRVMTQSSLFPGPMEDLQLSTLQGEMTFHRIGEPYRRSTMDNLIPSFSTFNGFGYSGQPLWELIDSLDFSGISKHTAAYDSREPEDPTFSGQIGGMRRLKNNGPLKIHNGDYVMWDIPNPNISRDDIHLLYDVNTNSPRILALTVPYRPDIEGLSINTVMEVLKDPKKVSGSKTLDVGHPILEGAETLRGCFLESIMLSLHILLSTGIIALPQPTPNDAVIPTLNTRMRNADQYKNWNKTEKANLFNRVASLFGLVKSIPGYTREEFKAFTTYGKDVKMFPDDVAMAVFAGDEKFFISTYEQGKDTFASGTEETMFKLQHSFLPDYLSSIERIRHFNRRRIIGRARSEAEPGDRFDIYLGRYI